MKMMLELRRRRVLGTVALYIVAAWVVIQAASELFPGLDIPDRAIRYVWLAAVLGFPVAILFAWRFQITSDGIFKTPPAAAGEGAANLRLSGMDFLMLAGLGVMILIIGLRAVQDIRQTDEIFGVSVFGREIHPNSIAVLPLDNLIGDPEQAYLVDGIHESMTSTLSQIGGLRVKSRTSTATYRDSDKSLPDIASELGVANVIVGSVRRDGEMIRVTVELIDARTDEYLWTSTYERELRDLLAMQSDVAREVASQVSVELTPEELARLADTRQVNPEVYETYLKGMFFVKQLEPGAIMKGMEYLHEAVAIDPREPLAYAGLALGYNTIGHGVSSHDAFPKAIAAAEKALELDELSGEAWAALAEAQLYYDWDWAKAEKNMLRAMQLSPSLDHVQAHYSYLLMLLGRSEEAIEMSERVRDMSPVDPLWAGFTSWLYMLEGQFDEAEQIGAECLVFATNLDLCRYALGQIYSAQGQYDKAIEIGEQIPVGDPFRNWSLGISYGFAGRHDQAQSVINAMSVNATPRDQLHIALAYAAMGEIEQAVAWMNVAYESRADWLPWVVHPHAYGGSVEPLREHAGFKAIVDQMVIPAAQPTGH
jgi:TolB-like protein